MILVISGITLLIPGAAPEPASPAWWWMRPLMFVVVLGAVLALSLLVARWEALGVLGPAPSRAVVAVAWLCAFVPPFVVMQWFLSPASALLGAVLLGIAVLLLRHRLFARQRVAQSVGSQA